MAIKKLNITAAVLGAALLSTGAMAVPTPVYTGADNIQDVLNGYGLSRYDAVADQTGAETFLPHNFGSTTTLIFDENFGAASGGSGIDRFGIYDVQNNALQLSIFDSSSYSIGDPTAIGFDTTGAWIGGQKSTTFVSGLGINFGFFFEHNTLDGTGAIINTQTVYSQSSLNDDVFGQTDVDGNKVADEDFFLAYRGDGGTMTGGANTSIGKDDWIIAADWYNHGFDATTGKSRKDFDDVVVFVSEMQVSAPATLALLGLGLLGMGAAARRKQA